MNSYSLLSRAERFCRLNGLKKTAVITLGVFAVSAQVQASGFQVMENSPLSQGMAMAGGGASPDDVTSIANNPAALGFVKKDQVYVGTSYLFADVEMNDAKARHSTSDSDYTELDVQGKNSESNVVGNTPIPAVYGSWAINDQVTAGLSITAPWGMNTEYGYDSVVRFMAQKTDIKSVNIMPMLSYAVTPDLSVAAGLQVQYTKMSMSNFNGDADPSGDQVREASHFNLGGWGAGFIIGVMAQPLENTYVGLSYHSQVKTKLKGDGAHYFLSAGSPTPPDPTRPYNDSDITGKTDFDTPEYIDLSITELITPEWDVRATAKFTRWSQYKGQSIDVSDGWYAADTDIAYDWHDTWYVALGTSYQLNRQWTLRTGYAWDQTPTNNATRDARTPDADRQTLSFGASYQWDDNLRIDMAYEHFFMDDTDINAYQKMGSGESGAWQERNKVSAQYSGSADLVAVGVSYQF